MPSGSNTVKLRELLQRFRDESSNANEYRWISYEDAFHHRRGREKSHLLHPHSWKQAQVHPMSQCQPHLVQNEWKDAQAGWPEGFPLKLWLNEGWLSEGN